MQVGRQRRWQIELLFKLWKSHGAHFKQVLHRVWRYFTMRLAFTVALFNVLVQWDGLSLGA